MSDSDAFGKEEQLARERENDRRRSEAEGHLEKYVGDQLSRIGADDSVAVYEDEFEAQLD